MSNIDYITLPVAEGQTNGTSVGTRSFTESGRLAAVGLLTPAAMAGTAVTIQGSEDGSTWYPFKDIDGNAKGTATTAANTYHYLDPVVFSRIPPHMRVVLGTAAGAGGEDFKLFVRDV